MKTCGPLHVEAESSILLSANAALTRTLQKHEKNGHKMQGGRISSTHRQASDCGHDSTACVHQHFRIPECMNGAESVREDIQLRFLKRVIVTVAPMS